MNKLSLQEEIWFATQTDNRIDLFNTRIYRLMILNSVESFTVGYYS